MPVVRVHKQRTLHDYRYRFDRSARKQCEAAGIIRIVGTAFDINPFAVEVRLVIDENYRPVRLLRSASRKNLTCSRRGPTGTVTPHQPAPDSWRLYESFGKEAYDDDANALSRLDIRESLNRFRKPACAGIRRVLRGEVHDSNGIARW